MKKPLCRILQLILLFAVLAIIVCFVFADRQKILTQVSHKDLGTFLVIGESFNLIEGWQITFCWRKDKGPWMQYYLDHESNLWRDVEIFLETNTVLIKKGSQVMGQLNTFDGSLQHARHKRAYHCPALIVPDEDPFNRTNAIYPESPAWTAVWPTLFRNTPGTCD
jgi:hypothetical protein